MLSLRNSVGRWFSRAFGRGDDLARLTRSFEQELLQARYAAIRGQKTSPITVTPQFASQCATVSICCRILAGAIGQCPIKMYEINNGPETDHEVRSHPVAEFLRRPRWCPWEVRVRTLSRIVWGISQWGNAYIPITWDRSGNPVELEVLDPWTVTPKWSDEYTDRRGRAKLVFDIRDENGSDTLFDSDLLVVRNPSPRLIGESPAQISPQPVQLAWHQENIAVEFCANSAKPSIVVTVPGAIVGDRSKFMRDLKEQHRTGDPLVLEYGAGASNVQIPFSQAQLLESRQFGDRKLAAMYGVMSHMLNDNDGMKYDNVDALDSQMGKYTFVPLCQAIEQELAAKLLTPEEQGRYYFKIKLDALLRGTMSQRYLAYEHSAGWSTIDEIRELEERDPLPNGEGKKIYQRQIIPENKGQDPGSGQGGAVGSEQSQGSAGPEQGQAVTQRSEAPRMMSLDEIANVLGPRDTAAAATLITTLESSSSTLNPQPPTQRSRPSPETEARYERLVRATLTALATQERTQIERAARSSDRAEKITRLYEDLGRKLQERFPENNELFSLFARRQDQLLRCSDFTSIDACLSGHEFQLETAVTAAMMDLAEPQSR